MPDSTKKTSSIHNIVSVGDGEYDDVDNVISAVVSPGGREVVIDKTDVDDAMEYVMDIKEVEIDPAIEKKVGTQGRLYVVAAYCPSYVVPVDGQDHQ